MLPTDALTPKTAPTYPTTGRPPLTARAAHPAAATASSSTSDIFSARGFALPKVLSRLHLPTVHNRPALALSATAMGLGLGSIASLASLTAALGPAIVGFVALTVAPLTAAAHLSAAGVLTGVVVYVAGAALVAAAAACAIVFMAMQARAVYHAATMAKHSITGALTHVENSKARLRQELSSTGLVSLWTSAALLPLSPFSALQSALVFGLLQSAQGALQLHLSKGPSEA